MLENYPLLGSYFFLVSSPFVSFLASFCLRLFLPQRKIFKGEEGEKDGCKDQVRLGFFVCREKKRCVGLGEICRKKERPKSISQINRKANFFCASKNRRHSSPANSNKFSLPRLFFFFPGILSF